MPVLKGAFCVPSNESVICGGAPLIKCVHVADQRLPTNQVLIMWVISNECKKSGKESSMRI